MSNSNIPFRVHYLNVKPSDDLTAVIEQGVSLLEVHSERLAFCEVHVGRWVQHHAQGSNYRVRLELELVRGETPLTIESESERDAGRPALSQLVRDVFARAAMRLSMTAQQGAAQFGSVLSPDARRLHPLHGLAPEDAQYDAGEE